MAKPDVTSVDLSSAAKQSSIGRFPISEDLTNYLTEEVRTSGEKDATKVKGIVAKKLVELKGLVEKANKDWTRFIKAREAFEGLTFKKDEIRKSSIVNEFKESRDQARTSFKALYKEIFTKAERFESECRKLEKSFTEQLFTFKSSTIRKVRLDMLSRKKMPIDGFMDTIKRDIALLQDSASNPNKSLFNGFCQKIISGARIKPSVAAGAAGRIIKKLGEKALQGAEKKGAWELLELVVKAGKRLFIKVAK